MARSASGESVLERAVRILEVFDTETTVASITDIAARADLPLATASRLVDELVAHGLLSRDSQRRVCIGLHLWELGCRASPVLDLRDAAMPVLEDLQAAIGQHVQIGMRQGHEVRFIERLSRHGARNRTRAGGRLPLYASPTGLVLLAFAPIELQHQVINGPLLRITDRTVTDPHRLRSILAQIRRGGFAIGSGFVDTEAAGAAVPIRDAQSNVIAGLSAMVPGDCDARRYVPKLIDSAEQIRSALTTQSLRRCATPSVHLRRVAASTPSFGSPVGPTPIAMSG